MSVCLMMPYLLRLLLLVVYGGLQLVQLPAGRQVAALRVCPGPLRLLQQSLRLLQLLGERLAGLHRSRPRKLGVLQLTAGGQRSEVTGLKSGQTLQTAVRPDPRNQCDEHRV